MRIENEPNRIGSPLLTDRVSQQRGAESTERCTQSVQSTGPDVAVLSQRAQDILAAAKALAGTPEVRAEKVAELRRKIAAGAYEVDAEAVARKIVAGGL